MSHTPHAPLNEAPMSRVAADASMAEEFLNDDDETFDSSPSDAAVPQDERPTQVLTPAVQRVLEWHLRQTTGH